jgi:5'(3')-deoxyribonucleotidase
MITRILLDMDGVLADFVGHILTPDEHATVRGQMNIPKAIGITEKDMWKRTEADPDWWANIPPYNHTDDVIPAILEALSDEWEQRTIEFYIVTQPHDENPHCTPQKRQWVKDNLTDVLIQALVPTGNKHMLANSFTLLIDDDPRHVMRFRESGGHAILFPSHCNELHMYAADPIPFLSHQLELLESTL